MGGFAALPFLEKTYALPALLLGSVAALGIAAQASAEFRPAVVFSLGGIGGKSFNEAVNNGVLQFSADKGVEFITFGHQNRSAKIDPHNPL